MKEVSIHGKVFEQCISQAEIALRIESLGREVSLEYPGDAPLILSVLNGAFLFTADLVRTLQFDAEISFVRVSSYAGGMTSSGKVKELMGLTTEIEGRDVLIVEDIVDTGHTIEWLRKDLAVRGAKSVKVCALLFKKEAFLYDSGPNFSGFVIPNEFVVGYGLDYDQRGRGLDAIYKLKV
jgi:hypoxanthine phosphoribosyltransferase